jgi:hypothetical protein
MTAPAELAATHSHLYPGARGHAPGPPADGPVVMCFADGARAAGRLDGAILALSAYRTSAGRAIPARAWRLAFGAPDAAGRCPFRVAARVAISPR